MKEFTKSDLKNGMVVETREKERFIVVGGKGIGEEAYLNFDTYNEDLTQCVFSDLDIIKIYNPTFVFRNVLTKNLDLLWERPEIKEVTMAEVEEKFGCKVKIVKE